MQCEQATGAIKILQLNMHRGKTADSLLSQIAIEQCADVMIISEQYLNKDNDTWFDDETGTAAIWIPRTDTFKPKKSGKRNGFVWVQLDEITLVSCYLTPSDNINEFHAKLEAIEDEIRCMDGQVIVAGDFNARAVEWGSRSTNSRGRSILQMAARTGLIVANAGCVPTFRRPGCEGTIPDITLASESLTNKIKDWKVLEIYTASDHQYITYSLQTGRTVTNRTATKSTRKWNVNRLNETSLKGEIDRQLETSQIVGDARAVARQTMHIITRGCNKAMPKLKEPRGNKIAVYWWNNTIDELRRTCLKLRRKFTRARRRSSAVEEHANYKEAKKNIRKAIENSKRAQWEELRNDINRDPWGLGYKVVMKKLGTRKPVSEMDEKTMENIVSTLFPTHETRTNNFSDDDTLATPLFTTEELQAAARKLKNKKAPGPDGVPAEVIKIIADSRPELLLNMYNRCLTDGIFPEPWKEQNLVLISKGKGDASLPSSYRPLCMLDTAGKLLERLIKPRLDEAISCKGGLSERQHGFRPGKSTVGAIKNVIDAVLTAREMNHHTRPIVLLATLDVKNAFNSLRWTDVLRSLKTDFQVPAYLMKIISSYLSDRVLTYNTSSGRKRAQVTSGAAQGSILGPDLWNASYDEILRIDMPKDTFLVGYADDIAAVIQARNTEDAQRRLRQVMIRTKFWLSSHGLELAAHKTELLLLTRQRIPLEINMQFGEAVIPTKKSLTYLGIRLDSKLTYSAQIRYATTKAAEITANLSRLMANVGGPLPKKRRLLMEACNSILLYGCEIWAGSLNVNHRAQQLITAQRTAALRVASAYRTVSAAAVQIIAGMIPIDLQAEERMKIFMARQNNRIDTSYLAAERDETFQKWQTRWNTDEHGRWTAKLIPEVKKWVTRKTGDVNYYITQMLSGHGYFRKYLYKMGKCDTPLCLYEEHEVEDDAEHTFFRCIRWAANRGSLMREIGDITVENIVDAMVKNDESWNAISNYCECILRMKKQDLDNNQTSLSNIT